MMVKRRANMQRENNSYNAVAIALYIKHHYNFVINSFFFFFFLSHFLVQQINHLNGKYTCKFLTLIIITSPSIMMHFNLMFTIFFFNFYLILQQIFLHANVFHAPKLILHRPQYMHRKYINIKCSYKIHLRIIF